LASTSRRFQNRSARFRRSTRTNRPRTANAWSRYAAPARCRT
jgi:hypothetical protein